MQIGALVRRSALWYKNSPCLVEDDRVVSYREFDRGLDAPLRLGWTGGTTGQSKAVTLTTRGELAELLISGGFNVYPRVVEEVLLEFNGVIEAAVIEIWSDIPKSAADKILRRAVRDTVVARTAAEAPAG